MKTFWFLFLFIKTDKNEKLPQPFLEIDCINCGRKNNGNK